MNIAPYIKLYKDNRISTRTIEKELANHIVNIPNIMVKMTHPAGGHSSSSYICGIMPIKSKTNLIIPVLFLDDYLVRFSLSPEITETIVNIVCSRALENITKLSKFISANNGSEVPLSECIKIYADIIDGDYSSIPSTIIDQLEKIKLVDFSPISDIKLSLSLASCSPEEVLEYAQNSGIFSKEHIDVIRGLFTKLNNIDVSINPLDYGTDTPINYKYSNIISSKTDSTLNFVHKEIKPDFTPDSQTGNDIPYIKVR